MDQILDVFTQFPSTQSVFGFTDVLVNTGIAFLCALIINYAYNQTHRSVTYSESYLITLVMMTVITAIIMMVIGSNIARAFSLVGALSIIRFRTAVKDIKDTGFIFFAIAVGMAVGTGFYIVGISLALLLSLIIVVLDRTGYGRMYNQEKLLMIETDSDEKSLKDYAETLKTHTRYFRLIHTDLLKEPNRMKVTYTILPKNKKGEDESNLIAVLNKNPNIKNIKVLSGLQDNLVL